MVFWSRDPDGTQHFQGDSLSMYAAAPVPAPDGTQHFQGDSLGKLVPGINGPTSLAAIRNADDDLAKLRQALADQGLADTTDIVIAADHGFSTMAKESKTSPATKADYADVVKGELPVGFLALDIGAALDLPVWDPDAKNARLEPARHPIKGNGLIGASADKPEVVVGANGGSDLIYLPNGDKALAAKVVEALLAQDYVSGLFVEDDIGRFPGTLPLSAANLYGAAVTPRPAIAVNFRSFDTGCGEPLRCTVEIADSGLQTGQGMHGSFSRADTANFMAAIGPDFKSGFADPAPASNADVGKTIARILRVTPREKGKLVGRVLDEAMTGGGDPPQAVRETVASEPAGAGLRTMLETQRIGDTRYFDAVGFPGRSVGLSVAQRASAKP